MSGQKSFYTPSPKRPMQWAYNVHLVYLQRGTLHHKHVLQCAKRVCTASVIAHYVALLWVYHAHYIVQYTHCTPNWDAPWIHQLPQPPRVKVRWSLSVHCKVEPSTLFPKRNTSFQVEFHVRLSVQLNPPKKYQIYIMWFIEYIWFQIILEPDRLYSAITWML